MPEERKSSGYSGNYSRSYRSFSYGYSGTSSEYVSLDSKKEAAEYLIRIVPRNLDSKQRKLFDLYQNFTKSFTEDEYCEIDHNEGRLGIWDNSNKYIFKIIRDIIEKHSNVDSLANDLNKTMNETLECLKSFIENFSEEGKIVPNQNGVFCEIKNLMNDGDNENSDTSSNNRNIKLIPEELKDIAKKLGYDIRAELVHESMERPCSRNMSYEDVCKKIDEIMEEKYNNKSTYNDEDFKDGAYQLIEQYFKTISEKEKEKLFKFTYSNKSHIIVNVIIDEQARQTLVGIRNVFDDNQIKRLMKHAEKIKEILKELESPTVISNRSYNIIKIIYKEMDHSLYNIIFELLDDSERFENVYQINHNVIEVESSKNEKSL